MPGSCAWPASPSAALPASALPVSACVALPSPRTPCAPRPSPVIYSPPLPCLPCRQSTSWCPSWTGLMAPTTACSTWSGACSSCIQTYYSQVGGRVPCVPADLPACMHALPCLQSMAATQARPASSRASDLTSLTRHAVVTLLLPKPAGTRITTSHECPRRSFLDERVAGSGSNDKAVKGTLQHNLIQVGGQAGRCTEQGRYQSPADGPVLLAAACLGFLAMGTSSSVGSPRPIASAPS